MKTIFIIYFILFFYPLNQALSQDFDFALTKLLTIGEASSDSSEYLFGSIRHVQLLENGNILIADRSDNTLRVFSADGTFISKIGRRGRGPGEFHEITYISTTGEDRIMVLDRFQARVSTFSTNGELLDTKILPIENLANAQFIFEQPKDKHLFIGYRGYTEEIDTGYFLHLFDEKLKDKQSQHLNVFDYFFDPENQFERSISRIPLYVSTKFGTQNIAVTPDLYTGTITVYNLSDKTESLLGEPIDVIYELHDRATRDRLLQRNVTGFATASGQNYQFIYKKSGSTFSMLGNQHFLLQYYALFKDSNIIPRLKIYSAKGQLLSDIALDESKLSYIDNNRFAAIPLYLDKNNNLYVFDPFYQDSHSALVVYKTNLHELLDE